MKEKEELVVFRVCDRNGRYQQSYVNEDDADACAKHLGGSWRLVAEEDKTAEWSLSLPFVYKK
jgi:hypothetical protein|tara:strand:+ start:42 stop:230 length:189 start_codon:yes stop_codon:yes gene_type:complete